KTGDDGLRSRFMVAFGRSVRREKANRGKHLNAGFATREEAQTWMGQLNEACADYVNLQEMEGRFQLMATWFRRGSRIENRFVDRKEEAEALLARWKKEGATYANIFDHGGQ